MSKYHCPRCLSPQDEDMDFHVARLIIVGNLEGIIVGLIVGFMLWK